MNCTRLIDHMAEKAAADCCTTQIIDMDGTFNADGLDNFIKKVKLGDCGLSYAIVAVMGPQSSGKSTLLNHLFHTNFREMDAYMGRIQTTKGIWMARCTSINVPCTIVMDLEGTDGSERGEDDTVFEKQSALFAIAVSDIVLINMWCHDIGREHAANKPLLRIVFQVMLQLCRPHKTTLMFVIRDKTRTPLEILEHDLRKEIQKIWDSVPKAEVHKHTQLSEFFNVEVVALYSYEDKRDQFEEQVANLRQKFSQSIAPGGLAGDRGGAVPASGFSISAQHIWKVIKENKELDLPSHKVMVATVRCEEIASEKYFSFARNKDWLELGEDVKSHIVLGFGKKLSSLLDNCLSSYDQEVMYFDGNVASAKRKQLYEKLMKLVRPVIKLMLKHIRSDMLLKFIRAFNNDLNEGQGFAVAARDCTKKFVRLFDEQCEDATNKQPTLDSAKIRNKFPRYLDSYITEVRAAKLCQIQSLHEWNVKEALCSPVEARLELGSDDAWCAIRSLLDRETKTVVIEFSSALSDFEIDEQEKEYMISKLKSYARGVVEGKAKEVAREVAYLMNQRFTRMFFHREWTKYQDIPAIAKVARFSALKLLSILAAIGLDGDNHTILNTLKKGTTTSEDLLTSSTWEAVLVINTLITPIQCKSVWDQFKGETEYMIHHAIVAQKGNKPIKKCKMWATRVGKAIGNVMLSNTATGVGICGTILGVASIAGSGGHVGVVVWVAGAAIGAATTGAAIVGVAIVGAAVVMVTKPSLVKNLVRGRHRKTVPNSEQE